MFRRIWYNNVVYQEVTEIPIQPELGEFRPPMILPPSADREHKKKAPVNLRLEYDSRGLQTIVKLASIHLTPEKPHYGGGSWLRALCQIRDVGIV